ncbi:hypothetical protein C5167_004866 [Papaver somniferum]|uniref:Cytochrome P450 n=1 Tax=Papaver somniferum TaxID=3469 RepID=A0A4Y7JD36_PAPSO|nr:hypothetical protein C5167_004866 [Papaver somniferum]
MLEAGKPNLSDYIPIISFMDVQGIKRRMRNYTRIMDDTFDKIIDHKLELAKEGKSSSSNDLLDIILGPSHDNGLELQRHDIKALLKDLLMAAPDTISATVELALAELLHNPSKMTKAQQELSNIIGKDRPIEEDPTIWADPTSFQSGRFLDLKIDYKGHHVELIPFGSGCRICPGLPLAHK